MFWYSSSRGGETQRRRVPRTKNFFICGGYNLSAFLCLKTTQFAYNSTYYQQVFGPAMDFPVFAVIAHMVMEDVEQRALATSPVKGPFPTLMQRAPRPNFL